MWQRLEEAGHTVSFLKEHRVTAAAWLKDSRLWNGLPEVIT